MRAIVLSQSIQVKFQVRARGDRGGKERAPEAQLIAFAVPFDLVVQQIRLRRGQALLRQGVEQRQRLAAGTCPVEPRAGEAIGRVAEAGIGNQSLGPQGYKEAARGQLGAGTGACYLAQLASDIGFDQFERVNIGSRKRRVRVGIVAARVDQMRAEANRAGIVLRFDHGLEAQKIGRLRAARAEGVVVGFVPRSYAAADGKGIVCRRGLGSGCGIGSLVLRKGGRNRRHGRGTQARGHQRRLGHRSLPYSVLADGSLAKRPGWMGGVCGSALSG